MAKRTLTRPRVKVQPYVDRIVERYGDKLVGVFMYGSMLSQATASRTSFPDFFVITDGYAGVFDRWSHRLTAYPLPPHIYHLRLDDDRHCKYNLLSFQRFCLETSRWATDIYILGRFGKRVALVHARDEDAEQRLVDCCANAMLNVAIWTLRGMQDEFDSTEFTLACLNISYAGETRVEASSKVPKLFKAEKTYYQQVYPVLLQQLAEQRQGVERLGDDRYRAVGSESGLWLRQQAFHWFLKNSQVRGVMRWPKFLLTVDEWVDIILAKIERTKGIKIEPSERARKYPLIFGWPHLFQLLRAGAIGTFRQAPDKTSLEP